MIWVEGKRSTIQIRSTSIDGLRTPISTGHRMWIQRDVLARRNHAEQYHDHLQKASSAESDETGHGRIDDQGSQSWTRRSLESLY